MNVVWPVLAGCAEADGRIQPAADAVVAPWLAVAAVAAVVSGPELAAALLASLAVLASELLLAVAAVAAAVSGLEPAASLVWLAAPVSGLLLAVAGVAVVVSALELAADFRVWLVAPASRAWPFLVVVSPGVP